MKYANLILVVAGLFVSCKKEGELCSSGCYYIPPRFYFIIADNQGKSVFTSTVDGISVAYQSNGKLLTVPQLNYPQKVLAVSPNPSADFIVLDQDMANASVNDGTRIFYLTYQGKTDTLGLDIHKVTATPDNGGHSLPVVSFDGRAVQSVPGNSINTPDYFVLKRR